MLQWGPIEDGSQWHDGAIPISGFSCFLVGWWDPFRQEANKKLGTQPSVIGRCGGIRLHTYLDRAQSSASCLVSRLTPDTPSQLKACRKIIPTCIYIISPLLEILSKMNRWAQLNKSKSGACSREQAQLTSLWRHHLCISTVDNGSCSGSRHAPMLHQLE